MQSQKVEKQSSVYNPSDMVEKCVQDSYHFFTNEWLNKYECKMIAEAIYWLKDVNSNWFDNLDILNERIRYFFNPQLCQNKNEMTFVVHNIFLRDILENDKISVYLHDPITFVSKPIAYFFLKHFPVHITVDTDKLKSLNTGVDFLQVGSFLIFDEDINFNESCIINIKSENSDMNIEDLLSSTEFSKAAVTQIQRGIFKIDEDKRDILPNFDLWDKINRMSCRVFEIEPKQTGYITVIYENGDVKSVKQEDFDIKFNKIT